MVLSLVVTYQMETWPYLPPFQRRRQNTRYKSELQSLCHQFAHLSALKLHSLLRPARTDCLPPETLAVLKEIVEAFGKCLRTQQMPLRFKGSIQSSKDYRFFEVVNMHLTRTQG
jgi:hypothetical protein